MIFKNRMVLPAKSSFRRRRSGILVFPLIVLSAVVVFALFSAPYQDTLEVGGQKIDQKTSKSVTQKSNLGAKPVDYPIWKGMAVDKVKHNYGTVVPTGTFETVLEPLCFPYCTIYFPLVDLSTLVEIDDFRQNPNTQSLTNNIEDFAKTKLSDSKASLLLKDLSVSDGYTKNDKLALLTKRGFKPGDVNQDRIIKYTVTLEDDTGAGNEINIFALFDGHGSRGHASAHAAALNLPKVLDVKELGGKKHHTQQEAEKILTTAMLQLDQLLPQENGAGCTAIVIVQTNSQIIVANVGDSKAVVAKADLSGGVKMVFETKPHKPHMLQERQRIESKGGRIFVPDNPRDSSRVFLPSIDGNPENTMALAMSRSLGDFEGKNAGFLIAEPTVTIIDSDQYYPNNDRRNSFLYLVLATDGLWDYVPTEDVVQYVGELFLSQNKELILGCEKLIERSTDGWKRTTLSNYRDDISILVAKL